MNITQYYENRTDDELRTCHQSASSELQRWVKHKPKNDKIWNVIGEIREDLHFIHEEAIRRGINLEAE